MDLWERTEQARGETQLAPPFWGFAWAGGLALARYVLDTPATVTGRSVLDLAAGSGLVAIAAAAAGATSVTACDVDELAAAATRLNAGANGVRVAILTADLLPPIAGAGAEAGAAPQRAAPPDVEVVLAGDVFYDRAMADRALVFLTEAARRGALVLVGDPGRAYLPRERMTALTTYDVPVDAALEDAAVKRTTVWRLDP